MTGLRAGQVARDLTAFRPAGRAAGTGQGSWCPI